LLKSKLEKFLAKRVLIVFGILAIFSVAYISQRWFALIGLVIGTAFCTIKLGSYVWIFSKILIPKNEIERVTPSIVKSIAGFIANQLILIILLLVSLKINLWVFIGIVVGVLTLPFVILINCLSEVLKITHNNFE
jgi:hypothetical protein